MGELTNQRDKLTKSIKRHRDAIGKMNTLITPSDTSTPLSEDDAPILKPGRKSADAKKAAGGKKTSDDGKAAGGKKSAAKRPNYSFSLFNDASDEEVVVVFDSTGGSKPMSPPATVTKAAAAPAGSKSMLPPATAIKAAAAPAGSKSMPPPAPAGSKSMPPPAAGSKAAVGTSGQVVDVSKTFKHALQSRADASKESADAGKKMVFNWKPRFGGALPDRSKAPEHQSVSGGPETSSKRNRVSNQAEDRDDKMSSKRKRVSDNAEDYDGETQAFA